MTLPISQPVAIFLLVMVIILVAPLLFERLKIPRIVGMILAGVCVGPYGFNLLERDASFTIFGEVGILLLMFQAAIDIDMYHLRRNMRPGLIFGLITFLLPVGIGIPVTRWALQCSWSTSVLISSMYASHTLITYPVVARFGLANSRGAVLGVCSTIVAVLLALMTLAGVVDVTVEGRYSWGMLFRLLGFMAVYAAVFGWIYPRITRVFFRKVSDSVVQFIFIMVLMAGAALTARLIGLEAILGAFFAGLVLNRFIPDRSALMAHIRFVGTALFVPYFLIGVGMLINVHVVFRGWGVCWVAAVMTLTALGSKWLSAYAAQKLSGLGADDRRMMFGLTSGKAAATIAATMIGYQYGLLTEDMMNGAVVMILLCCIVASVVTERSAKRIRIRLTKRELSSDVSHAPGFARQIVAVANPVTAEGLMKLAVFMRSPLNEEPVIALYVRNADGGSQVSAARNALTAAGRAAISMGVPAEEMERFDLNISAGLANVMRERDATDIVIGLHIRGNIVDSFFGNLTENLLRTTNRMIIMVRCFIPVDTISKIVVWAPANAEYETGFHAWVTRIANLTDQLGCRALFIVYESTARYIERFVEEEGLTFTHDWRLMENWDDFIILSSQVEIDDLLVVVGARKGSLSHGSDFDDMPSYLEKNFNRNNISVIYPSQFGAP